MRQPRGVPAAVVAGGQPGLARPLRHRDPECERRDALRSVAPGRLERGVGRRSAAHAPGRRRGVGHVGRRHQRHLPGQGAGQWRGFFATAQTVGRRGRHQPAAQRCQVPRRPDRRATGHRRQARVAAQQRPHVPQAAQRARRHAGVGHLANPIGCIATRRRDRPVRHHHRHRRCAGPATPVGHGGAGGHAGRTGMPCCRSFRSSSSRSCAER